MVGFHIRDGSNGEFALDTGGDDGFGTGSGEGALDSMEGERGIAPAAINSPF